MRSFLALLISIFITSCGEGDVYNSSDSDATRYVTTTILDSTEFVGGASSAGFQRFSSAYDIFQSKCVSCHSGYHADFAGLTSQSAWLNAGHVVGGNLALSPVFSAITGAGVGGREDMPLAGDGGGVSAAQLDTIRAWIEGI